MADITETEISNIFYGHTKAIGVAMALHAFQYAAPAARAALLEKATDELIEAANAIGCTVKKADAFMVLMQKTETKIAKGLDDNARNVVARAAEADELRRKLARAEAEILELRAARATLQAA